MAAVRLRLIDNSDFMRTNTVAFAVSNSAEFGFIRLTQIGQNHWHDDRLILGAVEFFGALFE
jgi:hypothetical protein